MLAIAVGIVSTFNPVMACLAFAGVGAPGWMGFAMLVINLVVPMGFLALGFAMRGAQRGRKAREAERRAAAAASNDEDADWDPNADGVRLRRRQVERGINDYTLRFLVNFFAVVVVMCFVSGAVILLGVFYETVRTPVIGTTTDDSLPVNVEECVIEQTVESLEFMQYGSWANFIKHCCCMARPYNGDLPLTELWACDNGLYKERQRRARDADEITPPRFFCATDFLKYENGSLASGGQQPYYDAARRRFAVEFDGEVVYDYW